MPPSRRISPLAWVATTYFAEGFPYTLIRQVASVYFRDMRMSLEAIGLTSLYGLPWVIKFLWGPLVDRYATRREWLLWTEAVLAAMLGAVVLIVAGGNAVAVAWALVPAAFVAATHDTAIDGYYMAGLDRDGQARYVGYRVMAYRIALMAGTGAVVTIGALERFGWVWAFGGAAGLFALVLLANCVIVPRCEQPGEPLATMVSARSVAVALGIVAVGFACWWVSRVSQEPTVVERMPALKLFTLPVLVAALLLVAGGAAAYAARRLRSRSSAHASGFYADAYVTFFGQDRIALLLAFIVFMRTGEYLLSAMTAPFMVDLGVKVHYGWISGGVGLPASIAGAMFGGYLIGRFGVNRTLWPILLAQNLTNLVYMWLAFGLSSMVATNTGVASPIPATVEQLTAIAGVHGFDQFSGGMGTALLMTFLMSLCKPEHKAAHYAIGTGVMGLSGLFTGVASGYLAARLGYAWFFGLSFVVSIPGMILAGVLARSRKN